MGRANASYRRAAHGDQPVLKIIYKHIDEIKPDPRNPRVHSSGQIQKLARVIGKLGCNVPLVLDRHGNLLAGHARYLACRRLGIKYVPTISLEHLDEHQSRAFALADNRLAELSEWDEPLLAQHLEELSRVLDFEIELTGFEVGEIDLRIQNLDSDREAEAEDAVELSPSASSMPVTRPGDLWILGDDEHRVLCADASEPASFAALMDNKRAAMVLSDLPYNLRIADVSGFGRIKHREFIMAAGEMSDAEFANFLTRVCSLFVRHSKDGSLHYLFMGWQHIGELLAAGKVSYTELKNIAIWVKNAPGMGGLYRSQYELVAIFKSGHRTHRNNVRLGKFGRNRSNVWQYPNINTFGRAGEEGNLAALHPCLKPLPLLGDAIMDASARSDIILDGFVGAGSTIIAAARAGRRCYALEIDPSYTETAVRRWQAYTRDRARHAGSGRFFDEMEAEAEDQNGG
jgi:DNA modification methylase